MPAPARPRPRLQRILALLERAHGPRPARTWGGGVSVLVGTILSQNTNDRNSGSAYRQLWRRFRSWNRVADAPVHEIERCIRVSGLSNVKAPRIRNILNQICAQRGKIDLQFLAHWPPDKALQYLLAFDGVGPKTANCVLLFAFGMPVFPVDTHIHRIARRLGLIPPRASAEQAHELLLPMIVPADRYALHVLLIAHGRALCRARNPLCARCTLRAMCPYGKRRLRPGRVGIGHHAAVRAPRGLRHGSARRRPRIAASGRPVTPSPR